MYNTIISQFFKLVPKSSKTLKKNDIINYKKNLIVNSNFTFILIQMHTSVPRYQNVYMHPNRDRVIDTTDSY